MLPQPAASRRVSLRRLGVDIALALCVSFSFARAADKPSTRGANSTMPFQFNTLVAHFDGYGDADYLQFIAEARPEVAQFGFYGAHFWGLSHTPQYKGYPAHFPVQGNRECAEWFASRNQELHKLGTKVVGHMNVKFLVGDLDGPEGPRGFFKFYQDLWDETVLGPKPTQDVTSMLERDKNGNFISQTGYQIGKMHEYWGCLNNPDWRQVLKAWVRFGIKQGVDGFVSNYFYRHDCHCVHCVAGFKAHMKARFSPKQLHDLFGIEDLASHVFEEISCWHKPTESTPLRREMLLYSQLANKKAFDEVFVEYGRSLKPDLLVAQWNHLSYFSQISGDERCMLPKEVWGKDEDYLWYSCGGAGNYTDLPAHYLGEGTLQARYIRGAFENKPFTLGKYENTRIRVAIAELAANGGAPMGFYTRFNEPHAREVIVRYYQFIHKLEAVFRGSRPHADVLLRYPRTLVQQSADVGAVEKFKRIGERLLDAHVLFEVQPDDLPPPPADKYLSVVDVATAEAETVVANLPKQRTQLEAPWTVRLSANRDATGNGLSLHLVNYDRTEPEKQKVRKANPDPNVKEFEWVPSPGKGAMEEKPVPAPKTLLHFVPPLKGVYKTALAYSPEWEQPVPLSVRETSEGLQMEVPGFLVYCVIRLQ